jgi:hypothetical protein
MNDISKVFENARKIDIYLCWQTIADGRKQIRRYSPNASNNEIKLFELQSKKAINWLNDNGDPEWPDITASTNSLPYDTFYIGKNSCKRV